MDARQREFEEQGFVRLQLPIEPDLIERAAQSTRKIAETGFRRAQDMWRVDEATRALACHPAIMEFLEAAYGHRPMPFQTLNFCYGSQQKPHSDTMHFSSTPAGMMAGVWIALEDVDETNGPLVYYPGSHKLPIYSIDDVGGPDYVEHYEPFVQKALKENGFEAQTALLKKGEVGIWAANLVHGGSLISDAARTRLSLVTHYYFEGAFFHTPMREKDGLLHVREVFDISRNAFVRQKRNGKPIRPSIPVALAARYRRLTNKVLIS